MMPVFKHVLKRVRLSATCSLRDLCKYSQKCYHLEHLLERLPYTQLALSCIDPSRLRWQCQNSNRKQFLLRDRRTFTNSPMNQGGVTRLEFVRCILQFFPTLRSFRTLSMTKQQTDGCVRLLWL